MPHNIFHGQPYNPFGLLSDAAQDYLSGDLRAARGRPFLPGMTVNPVTPIEIGLLFLDAL